MRPDTQPAEHRQAVRRRPRGTVLVSLSGHADSSLTLIDVSEGGFAITSPQAFSLGIHREFTFKATTGQFLLQAKAVHCAELFPHRFLSGWVFLPGMLPKQIRQLVDAAT